MPLIPTTYSELVNLLKDNGYRDLKKVSGKRVAILTNDNRVSMLEQVEEKFSEIGAKYDNTPSSTSSVGMVNLNNFSIMAKPKNKQGARSAGIENEMIIIKQINDMIKEAHSPIDIVFKIKGKSKTCKYKDIAECVEMGRDTSGRKKADIVLVDTKNRRYGISLKKDGAEIWESADRYWGDKAKKYLDREMKRNNIALEDMGNFFKINPNFAIKATGAEVRNVVFGSDLLGGGAVVFRTFSGKDFSYEGSTNTLTILSSAIITEANEVKGDKAVWFLIRNDKTRNIRQLYKGLRVLAVKESRVNKNVLRVKR